MDDVPVTSWEVRPLGVTEVESTVEEDTELEVWINATTILHKLYLKGKAADYHVEETKTENALVHAWAVANNGKEPLLILYSATGINIPVNTSLKTMICEHTSHL